MIFITGDTHGDEFSKLNTKNFPIQKELTKDDYVIVTGDCGLVWDNSNQEKYWLKWLEQKPFKLLYVDGNHENFDLLNSYKVEYWNGGKVHKINNSVIHLMRGQVFELDNKKIFTFGGAETVDKEHRKEGKTWWKEEIPSEQEFNEGLENLSKYGNKVDYIISHTCDSKTLAMLNAFFPYKLNAGKINFYFDKIRDNVTYDKWYFGHFHDDIKIGNNRCIYQNVIKAGE